MIVTYKVYDLGTSHVAGFVNNRVLKEVMGVRYFIAFDAVIVQ